MSSEHVDVNPILEGLVGRKLPRSVLAVSAIAIGLGLLGFIYGLFANPAWAWGAFVTGLVYSLGIAQGAVIFAVIMTLTWGRWGRPLKRIGEAAGFYLPVGYVLLLIFLFFGHKLYPFVPNNYVTGTAVSLQPHSLWGHSTKPFWLGIDMLIARQALGVGFMILISFFYIRASLRPDLIQTQTFMRQKHPEWKAPGWWSWFTGNPKSIEDEVKKSDHTQSILAVILAWTYAIVFSFVAFDLVMALSPWWYSNMFGGWVFASSFWLSLAFIGIVALMARDWLGIRDLVTRAVTHDLGKLTLAFCMFWAYTLFAQILPIWYGNMPDETQFLLVRMRLPEWAWLARTVGVLCFLMPFTVLTSRGIKKMKWPFIGILSTIMLGLFLERTLLVMPSVYLGDTFPTGLFLAVSIPVGIGFVGLVTLCTTWALSQLPPVTVSDPRLQPHPWDVHVHPIPERGQSTSH